MCQLSGSVVYSVAVLVNTDVCSHTSLLWSEIELTIPSPSFHTHTTLDCTVTSDFSDDKSNTEPGSPSLLALSNTSTLSSLTPIGTIAPIQPTPHSTMLNMTTTVPRMPIQGQNSAPKFEGTAPPLNHFFSDFEYLANILQLTEAQKKCNIVCYLSTKDADFWTQ
jgi:hypothetical protein